MTPIVALGNRVLYWYGGIGRNLASGIIAEIGTSPLTGKRRVRVVDFASEMKDPMAGHWIDAADCSRLPELQDTDI